MYLTQSFCMLLCDSFLQLFLTFPGPSSNKKYNMDNHARKKMYSVY